MLLSVLVLAAWTVVAQSPKKNSEKKEQKDPFTRPKPSRPIKPEIPSISRYQSDKVFLERADSLYTLPRPFGVSDSLDHQIVKGNVMFRQGGMTLTCDSAYYYPELNSLDAFGHVVMEQGDTLFGYADVLYYDGDSKLARLHNGPTQRQVILENRDVTLTTDSLAYNLETEIGRYECGGEIRDKVNILTSIIGEYSSATKESEFYHDVVLVNKEDKFTMYTDTLFYNTETHIARICSPTLIEGETDTIHTNRGIYNTDTDEAWLTSRSLILHTDSTGNVTTLEGDSIIYDKATHITRAYMFRSPFERPQPMVITDTANKAILIGGFGLYNDSLKYAFATNYPLLMDYSRTDTLFLRADTIHTMTEQRWVMPPPTPEMIAARDSLLQLQSIAKEWTDSLSIPLQNIKKILSAGISILPKDTLITAVAPPLIPSQNDSIPPGTQEIAEAETWRDEWGRDSTFMELQEFHRAHAFRNARFFKQDMQGVADSIAYSEFDSLIYMYYKPVIWSENRQINGPHIMIHVNDSTSDWALLPQGGMMAEEIEEDFFNQLSSKQIKAYFDGENMRQLDADGNVMTIFLPMEEDSTYNKLIYAESSFMTVNMAEGDLERLKMWPEVTGDITPLFMIKENQKKLPGFLWLDAIRPRRQWYGDHWHWEDELGEVPEALEQYFRQTEETHVGRRTLTK